MNWHAPDTNHVYEDNVNLIGDCTFSSENLNDVEDVSKILTPQTTTKKLMHYLKQPNVATAIAMLHSSVPCTAPSCVTCVQHHMIWNEKLLRFIHTDGCSKRNIVNAVKESKFFADVPDTLAQFLHYTALMSMRHQLMSNARQLAGISKSASHKYQQKIFKVTTLTKKLVPIQLNSTKPIANDGKFIRWRQKYGKGTR